MSEPLPKHIHDKLWGPQTSFPAFLDSLARSVNQVIAEQDESIWLAKGHLNFLAWLAGSLSKGVPAGPTHDLLFGLLRHIYTSGCVGWITVRAGYPIEARGVGRALIEASWLFELGCENPDYLQNWWHQMQLPTGGGLRGKLLKYDQDRYGKEKAALMARARKEMHDEFSAGTHPTFFSIIVPWMFDETTQSSYIRFGPVEDEFAVRRGEEHYLMLIDAVSVICADRATACFPGISNGEDLVGGAGALQHAFFDFSKRIREELMTPATFDHERLAEALRVWSRPRTRTDGEERATGA